MNGDDAFKMSLDIFDVLIPRKTLTNIDIDEYVKVLNIPNYRGTFMLDELPKKIKNIECGIVNFNFSYQSGTHWVCYYKNKEERLYFDSFGLITPIQIQKYLKTSYQFKHNIAVIDRQNDVLQPYNTVICGHLCLYFFKSISLGYNYRQTLNNLTHRKL